MRRRGATMGTVVRGRWAQVARSWWIGLCVVAVGRCAPPKPTHYDRNLGVEAVSVAEGALAGTFALKSVAATLVHVPFPGVDDEEGGGYHVARLTRTWDDKRKVYQQVTQVCGGENFTVHGVQTGAPTSTFRAIVVPPSEILHVEHDTGVVSSSSHTQLWGIKDLPDLRNSPLPKNKEEAAQDPEKERIYDVDQDSHPGYTTEVAGTIVGQVYGILRKNVDFDGLIVSPDHILGLNTTHYDSLLLEATNPILDAMFGGEVVPFPDPKESWYEEVRVDDATTCDDILHFVDSGKLSKNRPF